MGKKSNAFSEAMEPLRKERQRQKEAKANRKPINMSEFIKVWSGRLFHTIMFCLVIYVLVLMGTIMLPGIMAYVLAGLGYTLTTPAELMLSLFSGLFLTAWFFTITFVIVKKTSKIWLKNMKKTMSAEAVDRLNELD